MRCSLTVTLQSTLELPSVLDRDSTLREWTEDARGIKELEPIYQLLRNQMQENFVPDDSDVIGMDPMGFFMDTPLVNLLYFFGESLSSSPEDIVEGLLAKVHGSE
jgi:beta-glucosidase